MFVQGLVILLYHEIYFALSPGKVHSSFEFFGVVPRFVKLLSHIKASHNMSCISNKFAHVDQLPFRKN